jgi:hypothetical protein
MDVMSASYGVVLSYVSRGLVYGESSIQRVLLKCLDGFIVSDNSALEHVGGPNP